MPFILAVGISIWALFPMEPVRDIPYSSAADCISSGLRRTACVLGGGRCLVNGAGVTYLTHY